MKIKDIFTEVFTGINIKNNVTSTKYTEYKTFYKDAIQFGTILDNKLVKEKIYFNLNPKYFMKDRDIIISLRKPYKVGAYHYSTEKKEIVLQNNFAILRGINMDLYSYIFITNYLDNIGIEKYLSNSKTQSFSLEDIKNIEIPDIPKIKQMEISKLTEKLNERIRAYSQILENDSLIIKTALNKVINGDQYE